MQLHFEAFPAIFLSAWLMSRACAPTAQRKIGAQPRHQFCKLGLLGPKDCEVQILPTQLHWNDSHTAQTQETCSLMLPYSDAPNTVLRQETMSGKVQGCSGSTNHSYSWSHFYGHPPVHGQGA